MPFIEVSIAQGRSTEKVGELIQSITDVVSSWDAIAPDEISVLVTEVAKDHWGRGGVTIAARK